LFSCSLLLLFLSLPGARDGEVVDGRKERKENLGYCEVGVRKGGEKRYNHAIYHRRRGWKSGKSRKGRENNAEVSRNRASGRKEGVQRGDSV
jgi:hypothetical protein